MSNIEKYNNVFSSVLKIEIHDIKGDIKAESIHQWDSITHLTLVNTIEDEFDVMLETEDILEFRSYELGKEILRKYDVTI